MGDETPQNLARYGHQRQVMLALRKPRKLKMQPLDDADAAQYEANAREYFESIREPYEQTLRTIRKKTSVWVSRIIAVIVCLGVVAIPFTSSRVVGFVFHQNTVLIAGHALTEIAGYAIFWSFFGSMILGVAAYGVAKNLQMRAAIKPLSKPVMVFALSYGMFRELENFKHSSHHHQTAVDLWGKLLTYLRWTFQGMSIEFMHFDDVPSSDYPVASYAEHFAAALHWNEVRKPEYDVMVGLNNLHTKLTQRVVRGLDVPTLKNVLRGLGNFFYSSIAQDRDDHAQLTWGYGELVRAMETVNRLPLMPPEPKPAPFISIKVFTQGNVVVSFLAWWMLLQILFVVVTFLAFRLFPALSINAQALVTVIAGPIAGAIAVVVGISRKSS